MADSPHTPHPPHKGPPQEGHDFYYNEAGLMVLTAAFLRRRGFCCGKGCLHCPYPVDGLPARPGSRNYKG